MKLNEILNSKVDFDIVRDDTYNFETRATIGGRDITVRFLRQGESDEWSVSFGELKDDDKVEYDATGKGSEHQVFAMVKASIMEFTKKRAPQEMAFCADKTKGKLNRSNLYDRLLRRFKIPGYSFERHDGELRDWFYIEKD